MKATIGLFAGLIIGLILIGTNQSLFFLITAVITVVIGMGGWIIALIHYIRSGQYQVDQRLKSL